MSEMKELIIDSASKIMEKYSTKEVVNNAERGVWASDLWSNLSEYGMLSVGVPESLGGTGGDFEDALSILRLAGKYSAPIPLAEAFMANWLLAEYGVPTPTQILTISVETGNQKIQFEQTEDGWIVSGGVVNVPYARFAESIVIIGESKKGSILAILPLAQAEIRQGKNMAGEARDQVVYHQALIHDCVSIPIDRAEVEKKIRYCGALTRSVLMTGALEKILEITIQHSKERTQFGRPIHRFQAVQHHIAALAGETAAAGIAADYAIDSYAKNPFSKEIALAKIRINEASGKANRIAHQVLAAIGFTYEHTLHHSTRRLWSWRDEYGTETAWETEIAKDLLTGGKDGLWSYITGVASTLKKAGMK